MLWRAAKIFRSSDRQSPAELAARWREYPDTAGLPGPRDPYVTPYMVPLANAVVSGRYERAVAATAAQSGKTDTALDLILHRLDQKPAPIIFAGPSAEFNRDQFEPRLTEMLTQCANLNETFLRGKKEKKTLKQVAGVTIRLASGASSTALKSNPAALAFIDEYDEMAANIRGQGDALNLVEVRGDTYADSITVVTSTTSRGVVETEEQVVGHDDNGAPITLEFWAKGDVTEIESPIWRLFQEGTRHHWAWPCPHCGVPFIPMRKHLHWDQGATPAQARRSAHLVCPNNGCIIEEGTRGETKAAMNARGFMIAPDQTLDDVAQNRNDPENATYSQWSSGLCSPFVTWGQRAERLLKAEMSGEEDKIQTAVNANFGEMYAPGVTGDMPDWKALLDHRKDYAPGQIHNGILRVVMGVDVQKRGLYYVIRGFGARGTSWMIRYGYLIGETAEQDVWEQLANIMLSPIAGVHIEKVFVDAGYRPDKPNAGSVHRVYDFARQYSFVVSPCKTRSNTGGKPYSVSKIEVKPDGKQRPFSINLVSLDPDFFKSLVHSRIKTPLGRPGAFYLHKEADDEYAKQVLSEVRLIKAGSTKPEWKPIRRDNHLFDCEALCAAAGYTLNVQAIPEGVERMWGEVETNTAPQQHAPEPDQATDQKPPTDTKDDLRNRFRRFGARPRPR